MELQQQEIISIYELSGSELDYQVARAIDKSVTFDEKQNIVYHQTHKKLSPREWCPSRSWAQAGALIEKYHIDLIWEWEQENQWTAMINLNYKVSTCRPLEAAMRVLVLSHQ